jgi:lysophospholipase L1-like esterase
MIIIEFGNENIILGGIDLKIKRLSILFAFVLALSTFFSSFAFADENNTKKNLVALGDSISFGYKLEANQTKASPNAFPNLIGNGKFSVSNLGVPGWTSEQLLTALNTDQFSNAVKAANVISLQIGNNDILQAANLSNIITTHTQADPAVLLPKVQAASAQLSLSLQAIVTKIKTQNPTAPIIFYNLYNPFGESADPFSAYLHTIGEQIITGVNTSVIAPFAKVPGIFIADAYTKYNGHQAEYISPAVDSIHPNNKGHQALASLADGILLSLAPKEITVDLTASTTTETKSPVSINVSTNAEKVLEMKWLAGKVAVEDFANAGTAITDNKFQVTENGTYTVYVSNSKGSKAIKCITIDNIKKGENPVPNPSDNGNNNTTPPPTPTPTTTSSGTGHALPDTATPMYNYLAIGLGLVLAGFAAMKIQQYRRRENI